MRQRRRRLTVRRSVWGLLGVSILLVVPVAIGLLAGSREGSGLTFSHIDQEYWVCRLFELFLGIWCFVVGSCIASFLNVVAYRLPAGLPITGFSFCPFCRVPIRHSDNVPVLGWLMLGGRCRACKLSISPRYPTFEFIGGLLMLSVYLSTVLSHGANLPWQRTAEYSYGIPVNLRFMDESVFYVAGLHAWLLFFLYAGALTSFGNGRLPIRAWLLGAIGTLIAIVSHPELCILPIGWRPSFAAMPTLSASPVFQALLTSFFGGFAGWVVAWLLSAKDRGSDRLAAGILIGMTLGWQAVGSILAIAALCSVVASSVACSLACCTCSTSLRPPIRVLWFWTAIFLVCWHWLHRWIDII